MKQRISPEIFEQARNQVLQKRPANYGIGTLGEKCLHAVLKTCYQPDERLHERTNRKNDGRCHFGPTALSWKSRPAALLLC